MIRRRAFLAAPLLATPALGQPPARVVVVGGGFGGATAARAIRRAAPAVAVTLITGGTSFTACPRSNEVIAGLAAPEGQVFGYDGVAREGITVVTARAAAVDPLARQVRLADGAAVPYDRLVLSPGIEIVPGAVRGYDDAAQRAMPHGWTGDHDVLRQRVAALRPGATVVIAIPATPYRCPPAPYERASLIAHAMQTRNLGGKILLLDSKESFSQQAQFRQAWAALYPGRIEWIGLNDGGNLAEVDAAAGTVSTDFETYTPDLACIIPPQRAAAIAAVAADRTGWCPVDPDRFVSLAHPDIHVIGDAAFAGQMSKSAYAAQSQARHVAGVIAHELAGAPPPATPLASTCTSVVAPDWGFTIANTYAKHDGALAEVPGGGTSKLDASPAERAASVTAAHAWYGAATAEAFG